MSTLTAYERALLKTLDSIRTSHIPDIKAKRRILSTFKHHVMRMDNIRGISRNVCDDIIAKVLLLQGQLA